MSSSRAARWATQAAKLARSGALACASACALSGAPAALAQAGVQAGAQAPATAKLAANLAACHALLQTQAVAGADQGQRHACITQVYRRPSAEWPAPQVDDGVRWQELAPRQALPAQPPALAALGEQLFLDPRLSRARDISCASCHAPHLGFGDGRRLAVGHEAQAGTRHTPHLLGVAFAPQLMWDGRAADLETQALMPIANPVEMAMDLGELQQRLSRETDYPQRFARVFGDDAITLQRLGAALAAFERGIQAPRSRFDDFIEGKPQALNEQELRGLHLFRTQARCMNCHSGPQLTQHEFHHIGMSFLGRRLEDLGRHAATGRAEDRGAMRTPTLRGLVRTAPYFHNGISPSLLGVVDLYNAGIPQPRNMPPASPLIKPLKLTRQEVQDLEAFLKAL